MHRAASWRSGDRTILERGSIEGPRATTTRDRERAKSSPTNLSMENLDLQYRGARPSFGRDSHANDGDLLSGPMVMGSVDLLDQNLDFSIQNSPNDSLARQSAVSTAN